MARRPAMSSDAFLNAVFHPTKAPRPKGIRKSSASVNSKRKSSRVSAFNRMDPLKQQIIIRAGNKEAYLRGSATLAESKQILRPQAVNLGAAKPIAVTQEAVAAIVAVAALRPQLDNRGKLKAPINPKVVRKHVAKMTQAQKRRAKGFSTYEELLEAIDDTTDEEGMSVYFYK
jgi:hypothetical protein